MFLGVVWVLLDGVVRCWKSLDVRAWQTSTKPSEGCIWPLAWRHLAWLGTASAVVLPQTHPCGHGHHLVHTRDPISQLTMLCATLCAISCIMHCVLVHLGCTIWDLSHIDQLTVTGCGP